MYNSLKVKRKSLKEYIGKLGEKSKPADLGKDKFLSITKKLFPVLILAAVLPLFIFVVFDPPGFSFSPRAGEEAELRLWIEPANVISSPDREVSLKVMALYENDSKVIPGVKVEVSTEPALLNKGSNLEYILPFSGKVVVGEISFVSQEVGEYSVFINESEVSYLESAEVDKIITAPATITIE